MALNSRADRTFRLPTDSNLSGYGKYGRIEYIENWEAVAKEGLHLGHSYIRLEL